ncbi:MAG: Acetoin:2,6-dichlorophenolindophenol oxidoreductase subunit beta [Turneriella sp.]|nr:Acetoin:2,6-dichlorophenolindophenol oxidoreductase subunit beta [Turneriella sp.]
MSSDKKRTLSFALAINEAISQMMEQDPDVFLIGQGVKSPWYVGSTCKDLIQKFGEERVIDTPVSESAVTGAAVGAAIAGMKSIVVHPRVDFMLYAFDAIINEAANWHYMTGGRSSVPTVIWGIVNRAGEQGAQHSQSLHAIFAHIPGLKVIMPSTPYDVKGMLIAAIRDPNPVIFLDERWLYAKEAEVPEEIYEVPLGKANITKIGSQLTIVASSYLASESLAAAKELEVEGISVEVIDLRTIKPLDKDTILASVTKTGRLLAVDGGWQSFGTSAEILAVIAESSMDKLKTSPKRLALPDAPAPAARSLEQVYYLHKDHIKSVVKEMVI